MFPSRLTDGQHTLPEKTVTHSFWTHHFEKVSISLETTGTKLFSTIRKFSPLTQALTETYFKFKAYLTHKKLLIYLTHQA